MKKPARRPLVVRRETVRELRELEQPQLVRVVGGDSNATCTTGVVAPKPPNG
jgi:hypothetical protein